MTNPLLTALLLAAMPFAASTPTPEEATRALVTEVIEGCLAGRNADVLAVMEGLTSSRETRRPDANYVLEMCADFKQHLGGGWEFGAGLTQEKADGRKLYGWPFFAKGKNEGQLWAFVRVGERWELIDIDSVKR